MTGLSGRRILVIEDEYMLADEVRIELEARAAMVLGPVGRLDQALALIRSTPDIDGALLDVNLGGQPVFAAVDLLRAREIPVILTTGYDTGSIPERYADIVRCEKPLVMAKVVTTLESVLLM